MKLKKLTIACGGTGGHFYPGLSIARTFQKEGGEVTLLLSGKHSLNQAKIAASYDIKSLQIPSSPRSLRPRGLFRFIKDLLSGIIKARKVFKKIRPDAFLAMGSFASIPSALAARSRKVPLFLHEGNARIGKANILLSRWAKVLAIAFPPVNEHKSKAQIKCIGMPVRPELLENKYTKKEAIEILNIKYKTKFSSERPSLLIFGGSQGTQIFNEIVPKQISNLDSTNIQVIHLTGAGKLEMVNQGYQNTNCSKIVLESSPDMDLFYQASDIIICRSGGSSLAELAIFSKFAVLVPYPYSTDGHQEDNANFQQSSGGAQLINNTDFTDQACETFLKTWLENPSAIKEKAERAGSLAKPHASKDMLALINTHL